VSTSTWRANVAKESTPPPQRSRAAPGGPHVPASVGPRPWQRRLPSHSSDDRQRSPAFSEPRNIPRQAAGTGDALGPTQPQPSCAFASASAQRSTSSATSAIAPERSAKLNMRAHSAAVAGAGGGGSPQQAARRAGWVAWSASQSIVARGSGGSRVGG
jgi:hypothetical protein